MAVSFKKEVILEAIKEVLAEGSKTVIVGNPAQTAQDIMTDPDVDSMAKKTAVDAIKKGKKGDKIDVPTKSMEEDHHLDPNDESDMVKVQLHNTAKYCIELLQMIRDGQQFDAWVQNKLTIAFENIDTVKHYLEGEEYLASTEAPSEEDLDEARDYQALVGKTVQYGGRRATVEGEEGDYIRLKFEDGKENLVSKSDFENKEPGVNEEDVYDTDLDDKQPSKKDLKAAEKETGGKRTHFTPEAQKMHDVIKIKVGKIEKKIEDKQDYKLDLAALKQYISKPEVRKALGANHIKGMVSSIIGETLTEGVSCCGRCGRVHESSQECKKPYISKDSPKHCSNKK